MMALVILLFIALGSRHWPVCLCPQAVGSLLKVMAAQAMNYFCTAGLELEARLD